MRAGLAVLSLLAVACGVPVHEDDDAVSSFDAGVAAADAGFVDVRDAGFVDAGPHDAGAAAAPVVFKIYTMNLRTAVVERDTAEQRTQMVADVILDELPDFVCVQEAVEMPSLDNRAAALAALTGYQFAWAQTFGVDGFFDEGIAILSRWPLLWTDVVDLPHPDLGGQNERKAIAAGLDTPDGEQRAFCSHMTTDPVSSFKVAQAERILELVAAHPGGLAFAGDLNATPDEDGMRTFVEAGLVDAWAATHPDDDGATHPSDAPDRRIDYVWLISDAARVLECHHVLDAPVDDVWASDHVGLICSLEL